jgi:hypothetical protein
MISFISALLAMASVEPAAAIPEPRPSAMSKSEIRDHNAKLDRKHRYFIRCVKAPDTGSLVARRSVCRTNDQWAAVEAAGRDQARNMADETVARSASSSN